MPLKICMDICSIAVLSVIFIEFYIKNNIPLKQNKILKLLVWLAMASTCADLLVELWEAKAELAVKHFPIYFNYIINYTYFITRNLIPFFYLQYVAAVLNVYSKTNAVTLMLRFAPIFISCILIAITPFTDAVFYVDAVGKYHRGTLLPILYGISLYYLINIVFVVFVYRKNIPYYRSFAFCTFVIISIVASAMQLVFPWISVETFSIAICLLLTYLTIQRTEEIFDGNTGLFNGHALSLMLSVKLKSKTKFCMVLIMIEDTSFWIDSLGIETAGRMLKMVADYLKTFREGQAYKVSNSQFCVILNEEAALSSEKVIKEIQKRFEGKWNIDDFRIKLSCRYSIINGYEYAESPEDILLMAGIAEEKAALPGDEIVEVNGLDLIRKLRFYKIDKIVKEAVEQELLKVVYQPIYSVKQQRFTSAEALLRLKHSELGNIPPDEFIPIAEKNGAIIKIGQFVRETVCRFIKENNLRSLGIEYIEINLSIIEGFQHDIAEDVLKCLKKYELDPECINLEITETAVNSLPETLENNLSRLSEKGIKLSLDDFGSGYSNVVRMIEFPCSIIKIDKSLVQSALHSESADTVLSGTFKMLKEVNKFVVAEGVETKEQAEKIKSMGCDFIQGYYYAKPMSAEEFLKKIS